MVRPWTLFHEVVNLTYGPHVGHGYHIKLQQQKFTEQRTTFNINMKIAIEQTSVGLAHTCPNNLILRPKPSIPLLAVGEGLGT